MTVIIEGYERISAEGHYSLDKTRCSNYGCSNKQEVTALSLQLLVGEGDLGP